MEATNKKKRNSVKAVKKTPLNSSYVLTEDNLKFIVKDETVTKARRVNQCIEFAREYEDLFKEYQASKILGTTLLLKKDEQL